MRQAIHHTGLLTLAVAGLLMLGSLCGCASNGAQPGTAAGNLVVVGERIAVTVAADQLTKAVLKDKSLSPTERQAAVNAANGLIAAFQHPSGSTVADAAWNTVKPLLQKYSEGEKAVIGPATFAEISTLMDQYIAELKAQESSTPATQPSEPAAAPTPEPHTA